MDEVKCRIFASTSKREWGHCQFGQRPPVATAPVHSLRYARSRSCRVYPVLALPAFFVCQVFFFCFGANISADIDNALHLPSRQRWLQYFTLSQFLAHFLRHSNFRPQVTQVLGGKPFLIFGICAMLTQCWVAATHHRDCCAEIPH